MLESKQKYELYFTMPKPKFLGKNLLVVIAHPDDESFTVSGTLMKNFQAGGINNLICATLGEKGKSHLKQPISESKLKLVRKAELLKVSKYLRVKSVNLLNLPDTQLNDEKTELYNKILKISSKVKPDYIFSFGSDGISGHLDHVAIGAISKKVAKELGINFVALAAPPALVEELDQAYRRRAFGKYKKVLKHEAPTLKIKIDKEHKQKALAFHKSQFDTDKPYMGFTKKIAEQILNYEYFVE